MRIINIEPKDIHVTIDFSAEQVYFLKSILDHSKIEFDSEQEPDFMRAQKFMEDILYPTLAALEKRLKEG